MNRRQFDDRLGNETTRALRKLQTLRAETAEAEREAILNDFAKLARDDRMIIRIAGMIEDIIERYRPTEDGDDR